MSRHGIFSRLAGGSILSVRNISNLQLARADKLRAETARDNATVYGALAARAALVLCGLGLVADLYVNESPEYIEFRVRRALRASAQGASHAPDVAPPLPVLQAPLALGFKPLMLLGPAGCGKSTLLARIAREAVSARTPTVLVRWRLSEDARRESPASEPAELSLAIASEALFRQIDYPLRRAWLYSVLKSGVGIIMGQNTQADLAPESRDRLMHALRVLFRAAEGLQQERLAAGMSALDAAPVLLFDEAHDLVKDERLASAGGRAVFKTLALLLIGYCVDRHAVRAVVAGGSVELDTAVSRAAPYNGRWAHYELKDPEASTVTAALREAGYTDYEARLLVAECGTRLRLLEGPLLQGAGAVPAAEFLAASATAGDAAVSALFEGLSAEDAGRLTSVLSAVAVADCAGGEAAAARPLAKDLPAAVSAAGEAFTSVVYTDRSRRVNFQSRVVARAWERREGTRGGEAWQEGKR